ncbi:MAG: mercuric reductase [Candidatus Cyclobacteriaceae bacterium M2_1C_046]
MKQYDAIIIGVGQAGSPLATALIKADYKVAVVENEHPGGSCVNYGCTPTKTMIASATVAAMANRGDKFGIKIPEISIDYKKIIERRDKIVSQSRDGLSNFLQETDGIDYYFGTASFKSEKEVLVEGKDTATIYAEKIFINTGTSPRIPEIPGVESGRYYTAKTIMNLDELPLHLIIIGGGYIGLEYGQMMRRFGAEVTIVDKEERLVPHEDEDVSAEMEKIIKEDGINIHKEAEIKKLEYSENEVNVFIKDQQIKGSHLLIAAGTTPNTPQLKLSNAGVETNDRNYIVVNEQLQTSKPHIYALGDVKGGPEFTHISYDDYRIVRDNLLFDGSRNINDRPVPYCMFTNPELGRIGLTEKQAKEKNIKYRVAKMETSSAARANETGMTKGFYKALVNSENDEIIGASIIAAEGGEISSMLQIAMMGNLKWQQLKDGVFAHPTYAESLNNLFQKLED